MKPTKNKTRDISCLSSSVGYIHGGSYDATTAYSLKEKGSIRLFLERALGIESVSLDFYRDPIEKPFLTLECSFVGIENGLDIFEAEVSPSTLGVGLYFFRPKALRYGEPIYGKRVGGKLFFNYDGAPTELFQLTVYDRKYEAPENTYGGIIYHIFVDRFARGGKRTEREGTVTVKGEWDVIPEFPEYPGAPLKNNTFYGGTLWGIADRLDYIASLGCSLIYLSPIFSSPSNHKYDTSNYNEVDPSFGGDEALAHLIEECKKRGIGIILDGVFNHTGSDSIYFDRFGRYDTPGAYISKNSPYYEWFDFKEYPDKYTCWWDIEILPRINPDKPECRKYFVGDGGVIEKYSKMGITGLRLDVADELSDGFISAIKEKLSQNRPSVLYGEVWEDASNKISYGKRKSYYLGRELDGVMNYPLRRGIIDYILKKDPSCLRYAIYEVTYNAPRHIRDLQMNFLGTHDTERILTTLGGESTNGLTNRELSAKRMSESTKKEAIKRLKAAYTVLATLPGIPAIFYGDEVGLEGYSDPFNRMPYPYGRENGELLNHYRKVGNIRRSSSAYAHGELEILIFNEDVFAFIRKQGREAMLTVYNNSGKALNIEFSKRSKALVSGVYQKEHSLSQNEAEIFRLFSFNEFSIYF